MIAGLLKAGVAQLVERNLAKVEVASSRLVSRSRFSGKLFFVVSDLDRRGLQFISLQVLDLAR